MHLVITISVLFLTLFVAGQAAIVKEDDNHNHVSLISIYFEIF
jgi:hypothetical protein